MNFFNSLSFASQEGWFNFEEKFDCFKKGSIFSDDENTFWKPKDCKNIKLTTDGKYTIQAYFCQSQLMSAIFSLPSNPASVNLTRHSASKSKKTPYHSLILVVNKLPIEATVCCRRTN